jgi:ligand-binding SRPBCC domain-containing protein
MKPSPGKPNTLRRVRILKSKITAMDPPLSFTDEMVNGDFKSLRHEHHFKRIDNGTLLIDIFTYEAPYGSLGKTRRPVVPDPLYEGFARNA